MSYAPVPNHLCGYCGEAYAPVWQCLTCTGTPNVVHSTPDTDSKVLKKAEWSLASTHWPLLQGLTALISLSIRNQTVPFSRADRWTVRPKPILLQNARLVLLFQEVPSNPFLSRLTLEGWSSPIYQYVNPSNQLCVICGPEESGLHLKAQNINGVIKPN